MWNRGSDPVILENLILTDSYAVTMFGHIAHLSRRQWLNTWRCQCGASALRLTLISIFFSTGDFVEITSKPAQAIRYALSRWDGGTTVPGARRCSQCYGIPHRLTSATYG